MEHHSEAFVALDTAKLRNAVAIADAGRNGEIRYLHALQQDALVFGFALEAMAAGSVQ